MRPPSDSDPDTMTLFDLLRDLGSIIGGVPGTVVKYAATILEAHEKRNASVRRRIELARRTGLAAGKAAYDASKNAGKP